MCDSFCEKSALFGVAGVCVNGTKCICPEGYSGKDDWQRFENCMVNESVQELIWIVTTATTLVCLVVGIASIYFLMRHWGFLTLDVAVPRIRRKSSLSQHSKPEKKRKSGHQSLFKAPPSSRRAVRLKEQWRRQRDHLLTLVFFTSFSFWGLCYNIPLLMGQKRYDEGKNVVQNLGLALATPCVLGGLWWIVYVLYRSLSIFRFYGDMLHVNSFLIKNPNFVRRVTTLVSFLAIILSLTLYFIIPLIFEGDDNIREYADTMYLVGIVVFIGLFWVFLTGLLIFLFQIIRKVEIYARERGAEQTTIFASKRTVYVLALADMILCPSCIILFMTMAYYDIARRNMYVFFNAAALLAEVAFIVACGFLVKVFAGPKVVSPQDEDQTYMTSPTQTQLSYSTNDH